MMPRSPKPETLLTMLRTVEFYAGLMEKACMNQWCDEKMEEPHYAPCAWCSVYRLTKAAAVGLETLIENGEAYTGLRMRE